MGLESALPLTFFIFDIIGRAIGPHSGSVEFVVDVLSLTLIIRRKQVASHVELLSDFGTLGRIPENILDHSPRNVFLQLVVGNGHKGALLILFVLNLLPKHLRLVLLFPRPRVECVAVLLPVE